MSVSRLPFLITGLLLLSLTGCAGYAGSDDQAQRVFPFVRLSPSAPPQSPYEEVAVPDEPMRQVWRKGYWDYDGTTFSWVEGHYIYRPDPTAAWTPDRWEHRAFGWAFIPGFWQ